MFFSMKNSHGFFQLQISNLGLKKKCVCESTFFFKSMMCVLVVCCIVFVFCFIFRKKKRSNWQEKYHLYTIYSPCLLGDFFCYRSHLLRETETTIEDWHFYCHKQRKNANLLHNLPVLDLLGIPVLWNFFCQLKILGMRMSAQNPQSP